MTSRSTANNFHVALLRGINVGGKNIVPMHALKACLEGLGLADVSTYIQSGNAIFKHSAAPRETLRKRMEKALSERFIYESRLLVIV